MGAGRHYSEVYSLFQLLEGFSKYNYRKLNFPLRCLIKLTDLVSHMTSKHHDFILTSHQALLKRTFMS